MEEQTSPSPPRPVRRIRLTVQYDGAPYCGWQAQSRDPSVQQTLEEALAKMLGEPVRVHAAGRTDTGVHALAMPVHFDTTHEIPAEKLPVAMTSFLPGSIGILDARDVPPSFDARRSAILRWYRYQIALTRLRHPLGPRAWHFHRPLDLNAIAAGLEHLRGHHDFSGFRSSQCQSRRTDLTLLQASLKRDGDLIGLDFKCRSFLHHQVRFMAGTMLAMGEGQIDLARLRRILDHAERPQLILCAPPQGLCLMGVAYTEEEKQALLAADPPLPSF
jgi:tRNA pseudouridine38-40 synthase